MKKTTIILIVAALFLCNAGIYFSYLAGKVQIHAQVESMMDKLHPDQLIAIADSSIKANDWDEQDKEFSYKNEMYDVVTIDTVGGQKIFYCLNDSKETKLENTFADQIEKQNGGKKTPPVLFLKFVSLPVSNDIAFESYTFFSKTTYPPRAVKKIATRAKDILHPPPSFI